MSYALDSRGWAVDPTYGTGTGTLGTVGTGTSAAAHLMHPNPFSSYANLNNSSYDAPFYPQLDHLQDTQHEWKPFTLSGSSGGPPATITPIVAAGSTQWPSLAAPVAAAQRPLASTWPTSVASIQPALSSASLHTAGPSTTQHGTFASVVIPIAISTSSSVSSHSHGHTIIATQHPTTNAVRVSDRRLRKPKIEPDSQLRPFTCHICGKSFSQAANLTAHKRVHTGEKPFLCPVCQRPFSQSSSLVTHKRTHSGERPYNCAHCEKSFTDSSTLTKHLRTHTGQKPYGCHLCLMRFTQSGNLHRHMKTHKHHN